MPLNAQPYLDFNGQAEEALGLVAEDVEAVEVVLGRGGEFVA